MRLAPFGAGRRGLWIARTIVLLLITLYLLLVIVLPLGLSAAVSLRTLPEGRGCPICRGDTLRLTSRWLRLASMPMTRNDLHRRWCPGCGWEGVARVQSSPSIAVLTEGTAGELAVRSHDTTGEAISVRDLEVNGRAWRVLLHYWCDFGHWYGRLLFIAPSGRLWADTREAFTGRTPDEVLGQALGLSDGSLTGRLRELISE